MNTNIMTVKDVCLKEYEKCGKNIFTDNVEVTELNKIELAGNLISNFGDDEKELAKFCAELKSNLKYKYLIIVVEDIISKKDISAAELFYYSDISLPGTVIKKIATQNRGVKMLDKIYEKYMAGNDNTHGISYKNYYMIKYNHSKDEYYLKRDLVKSPRVEAKNEEEVESV